MASVAFMVELGVAAKIKEKEESSITTMVQ